MYVKWKISWEADVPVLWYRNRWQLTKQFRQREARSLRCWQEVPLSLEALGKSSSLPCLTTSAHWLLWMPHSSLCLCGQTTPPSPVHCLFGFLKKTLVTGWRPVQMIQDGLLIPESLTVFICWCFPHEVIVHISGQSFLFEGHDSPVHFRLS